MSFTLLFADKALNDAAKDGNLDEVSRLLEPYKDDEVALKKYVNWQDEYDNTALLEAAMNGHTEIVDLLIAAGGDPNIKTNDGSNALMLAAWFGKIDIVKLLIKAATNLDIQNDNGDTALMLAAWFRITEKTDIVKLLIAAGANPNIQNNHRDTALRFLEEVCKNNTDIINLLTKYAEKYNIIMTCAKKQRRNYALRSTKKSRSQIQTRRFR
ncbi:MAG: hypothetical protein A2Y14_05495 [Verrucomicrobia bacterium GWF2_51_19]|nr:MAG: hypothetical protein A2Y14_05495 [Verrucomicrobia bacterium GWF2_51_19]HCJ12465.1 hypothetical protein [Opitutae bacterium]